MVVNKTSRRLTESAHFASDGTARNQWDAGAAPQSTGGMPGDEIETLDFNNARGVPVRILPLQTKSSPSHCVAAPVEVKFSTNDGGEVSGYGSVFDVRDSKGDVIESGAFAESLAVHKAEKTKPAMLWQHDWERPIGVWETLAEDRQGLKVFGRLNLNTQDGREAHALIKQGAISGLSIGYRVKPGGSSLQRDGRRLITALELWEISLVTFPANPKARIDGVKSLGSARDFEGFLKASGFSRAAARALAGGGWPALKSDDNGAADLLQTLRKATQELKKV